MRNAAWFLLLAGCPPDDVPAPCGDTVSLGTGISSFQTLGDGDELQFVHGEQGGYHLPLAARVCEVQSPGMVHIEARLEATGEVVSDAVVNRAWLADGCCAVLLDLVGYLEAPAADTGYSYVPFDPASIDGQVLVVTLTVADGEGGQHEASARITARQP